MQGFSAWIKIGGTVGFVALLTDVGDFQVFLPREANPEERDTTLRAAPVKVLW